MERKEVFDLVRKKINEAIQNIDGASFEKIGRISYSDKDFHFTLRGTLISQEQETVDRGQVEFDMYAKNYGFTSFDYGKMFFLQSEAYRLSGINPRNRKYQMLAKRDSDGKGFKFSPEAIRLSMKKSA